MNLSLTAIQVAEIVNSDERVKQAVVNLYLQRNPASLTITDLLAGEPQPLQPESGIGSLTTQQMMEACSDKRLME